MIVYYSTKKGFLNDVYNGTIADDIDNAFYDHLGRHTSPNEYNSWKNSMMYMNMVMNMPNVPDDVGVAIEYQVPLTSKRVDFIISGLDQNKTGSIIIIELKQWEKAELTDKPAIVRTRFQSGEREVAHPSYQAWSYAFMLANYNETIQTEGYKLSPCAYLHNYQTDNVIVNPFYQEYVDKAPVFFRSDIDKLKDFISNRIHYAAADDTISLIDGGTLRPSKQLADSLSSMLRGNQEFILLDDQKVVYETALNMARSIKHNKGKKRVLIVEGGPGTGKSVVAVNLLVTLTKEGLLTQYVSKNSAPRSVYEAKLSGNLSSSEIHNLFVGSGSFVDVEKDLFDTLIVDEAHRLNLKSGIYANLGVNQIIEIINASKFTVFFVDDRQKIHVRDIGTHEVIKNYAENCGAIVTTMQLSSQFRCNGSDGYLSWLDNTLQIKETANINLKPEDFDFRIYDNPCEMFDEIAQKNRVNNKSRVVAGYCWDWPSKKKGSNSVDINISQFDFHKKWNLDSDGSKWIIAPNSINEIGCIHTCQGLELDYVGVIVGPDISFKDGRIITDITKRSSQDRSIFGMIKKVRERDTKTLQQADEIVKNTYRTLMTRGIKGCYVYFCDNALAEHFRSMIAPKEADIQESFRIEPQVNDDVKYVDYLPYYSIKAACGYFGEGEPVEEEGWIKVSELGRRLNRKMFVVQALGHSMEPTINDADYCVFSANPVGSREGKIVLAEHHDYFDPDNNGSYSIKTYHSKKKFNDDGTWEHEQIFLEPKNKDYNPIILDENDGYAIVGEFIGIIKN